MFRDVVKRSFATLVVCFSFPLARTPSLGRVVQGGNAFLPGLKLPKQVILKTNMIRPWGPKWHSENFASPKSAKKGSDSSCYVFALGLVLASQFVSTVSFVV